MSKKSKRRSSPTTRDPADDTGGKNPLLKKDLSDKFMNILNSKGMKCIAASVLLLSVLFYYASIDYDYDLWFHLKYGEQYLKNRTWDIDHTLFSWTPTDPGWRYVTWISSSVLYLVYQTASVPGLYVMQWLIFMSIFFLYFFFIRSNGDTFDINHAAGIMLVAAALAPTAFIIKPELFTMLFFTITVFIYFYSRHGSGIAFLSYPIIFWIWVNTHGGFIFGLFFITLILFGEFFNYYFLKKGALPKKALMYLAITVSASYLATLLNPHGINYHTALLKYLTSEDYMGYTKKLYAYANLWQILFPKIHTYRPMVSAWCMLIMLGLLILSVFYAYKKTGHLELTLIAINLAFFYLGMDKSRASIFFPLLWGFSIIYVLKKSGLTKIKKKYVPISLLLLFVFWGISFNYYISYSTRSWFGSNMEEFIPVKEVAFIRNNKLPKPVFNDYLTGGYMIWSMYPEYKVFIDPRYGPYVRKVLPEWLNIKNNLTPEGLKKLTSAYPFKTALIHLEEIDIIGWLLKSQEWRLAYFDKVAVVIVHRSVFDSINPEALKINLGPERFRDISNPQILLQLFNFFLKIRTTYAREILDIYKKNVSNFYKFKEETISMMEQALNAMEFRLRQMNPQQHR